jgi:hypothetical protein
MEKFICFLFLVLLLFIASGVSVNLERDSFKEVLGVSYLTLAKEKQDCESAVIRANTCVAVIYFEERTSEK